MLTGLPSKILLGVLTVGLLGALGFRLHQKRQCSMGLVLNAPTADASRSLSSLIEVGLDPTCLLGAAQSESVLISIKVVPVIAENPQVAVYERVYRVSKKDIPVQGKLAEIPIPAAEISEAIHTDWNNTVWSVGVCADRNGNSRCDEPSLVQAMRLSGKHIQAMGLSNSSSITVSSDRRNGQACQL